MKFQWLVTLLIVVIMKKELKIIFLNPNIIIQFIEKKLLKVYLKIGKS